MKLKRIFALFITVTVIFSLCGCNAILDSMTRYEKPEEELEYRWSRDGHRYIYSEKVKVFLGAPGENEDSLFIKCYTDDYFSSEILQGSFTKVAWNDYKLFILMDDTYYMFDINAYELPEDENTEPVYELKEYSEEEMEKLYPDYESFNWYRR